MALILLVGASLLLKSFVALERVDNGFDARNALTMIVSLDGTAHQDHAMRSPFFRELVARIQGIVQGRRTERLSERCLLVTQALPSHRRRRLPVYDLPGAG